MNTVHRDIGKKSPSTKCIRVVHISDTHRHHGDIVDNIPDGDILIHTGDFWRNRWKFLKFDVNHEQAIKDMNEFFSRLPHKLKIFVAGNHEVSFNGLSRDEIQESLPHVTYLQDSDVVYDGLKIYGSPWTQSRLESSSGFAASGDFFRKQWSTIPTDTDILATHMPPNGVRDLGRLRFLKGFRSSRETCSLCRESHFGYIHQGSQVLREIVLEHVRPQLHVFGHMHSSPGIRECSGTIFSNAAQPLYHTAHVFDIYREHV